MSFFPKQKYFLSKILIISCEVRNSKDEHETNAVEQAINLIKFLKSGFSSLVQPHPFKAEEAGCFVETSFHWSERFCPHLYEGGSLPKMELSSEGRTLVVQASPHWVSVLGAHLLQCTSWWCCERLHLSLVKFFKRLNAFAHFMMGDLWAYLPTLCWVLSSFWHKTAGPCAPPFLFIWSHSEQLFFFPDEKSPQREMFCQCRRGETKNGRITKSHQNWWVQNHF